MQITNHLSSQSTTTEIPFEVKNGEIYSAQIKERISDREAVLQIRGKEVVAQFEDKVPSGERATVQVTGNQEQKVVVKEIQADASPVSKKISDLSQILQKVGVTAKDAPELKEAVKLLLDKGQPVSKEVVNELKTFFEKAEGTPESKSDTVRALVNKGLEVTQTHLRSIHEALHGKPLNEVLTNIAKELNLNLTSKMPELPIVKNAVQTAQPIQPTTESMPKASPKQEALREVITTIRNIVESEPDLQKAVQKVKEMIVNNPKIDKETAQQLEKVVSDAEKLQSIGKERIIQALKNAETQLAVKEQPTQSAPQAKVVSQHSGDISTVVREVRNEVQSTPNLQKSIEKVQTEVLKNSQLPKETSVQLEKAINEASALLRQGRITTGKEVLANALANIEKEISVKKEALPSEVIRNVKEAVQQEPRLQKAVEQVRDQVINNPKVDREVAQKIEKAVQEAVQLQKIGQEAVGHQRLVKALANAEVEMEQTESKRSEPRPLDVIKQVKKEVQQEPRLQKAVEQVREQVINNPKMDREVAQKIEKAVQEAVQLQKVGQEGAGRERLVQALANAEVEMTQAEAKRPESRSSEVIKQVKETVQQEPRLQKAVEQVRDQVINNPKIDREVAQKIEKAVQEAVQLQKIGQEAVGRERLVQALANAEVEMRQTESNRSEPRQLEVTKQVKEAVQQEPRLQKAVEQVREQVINNPKIDREVAQKIEKAVQEAVQLQKVGQEVAGRERIVQALANAEVEMTQVETKRSEPRSSEVIKQVKEAVQQEPRLQKAVEQVRDQVINNPKIDREVAQKIEKAVQEAVQLQKVGQEGAGRERLVQALANAEVEMTQVEAKRTESRPSEVIKQVKEAVQQEPRLQKAVEQVREQIINNPKIDREVAQKIEKAVQEAVQLQKVGQEGAGRERLVQALANAEVEMTQVETKRSEPRSSEVIKQVKEAVQQEPRLQKAVEQVRDQIINNPKIDREVAQKVEKAVQEATQLQKLGQEGAGRERLVQALANAEVEMTQVEAKRAESRPSEVIKQVKEAVQQEPRLQKAVEQVQDQIINNPKIDREVARKIERAVQEAMQLQKVGQEGAGRERLMQTLTTAETEMLQAESNKLSAGSNSQNHNSTEPKPTDTRQQPAPTQETAWKDTVKQIREQLQQETDIKKVLPRLQEQIINNKNIDPEIARSIEKAANQAQQLDQAGRDRIIKLLQQIEETIKQSDQQVKITPTEQTTQDGKLGNQTQTQTLNLTQPAPQKLPSETIQQAIKQFQAESDVDKALNLVRKEISSNPNIDLVNVSKIEKSLETAQQLSDKGREIAARQQVAKELTEVQQSLAKSEPKLDSAQAASSQYDVNELLQSMQIQSKDILVTKVTQKLAEATHEFRELKREITRTLDSVQRTIDMFKSSSHPQASKMLETAISKLDNAILKSDMMLFTDMKTEKDLLQASTQLAEAKKLLAKGNFSEASKIVGQVKELIDKINFKPSDQKVMHFVGKESLAMESKTAVLETGARGFTMQEPSARQMFEMVRSMGLNHDNELANSLVFKNNGEQSQQEQQQQNIKAVLMKLQQEEAGARVGQQVEQALNNLTGQQLLSKADSQGTMQSMLFNLPMLLGGKPENLQVFVNSKNEGQQVDWENCNLYFLIETKKLGDVGIMLASTERNLSITLKNDMAGFKERMEPIASIAKEKLKDIGYNVNSLNFTRMTPVQSANQFNQTIDQTPKKPIFTEKGLDFKI